MPVPNDLTKLNQLISLDFIPESLSFVQGGLEQIFDKLYYRGVFHSVTDLGDEGYILLQVVMAERVAIVLGGENGISLVFNPDHSTGSTTQIDLDIRYQIPLRRISQDLSIKGFAADPKSYLLLLKDLYNRDDSSLLKAAAHSLIGGSAPYQTFVQDVNNYYSPSTPLTFNNIQFVEKNILAQLDLNSIYLVDALLQLYIVKIDFNTTLDNLRTVIKKWVGGIRLSNILNLFIPSFDIQIPNLSFGLELPRNILTPIDDDPSSSTYGEPLPENIKSIIRFTAGTLQLSTGGITFDNESSFTMTRSSLFNTGLELEINGLKLDLSRQKNIAEISADQRPEEFIGVYIEDATITLPSFWNQNSSASGVIKGRNLIIGTGGFSGTLGIEAVNGTDPNPIVGANLGGGFAISLDAFDLTFQQNEIISSSIYGTLTIPNFNKKKANPTDPDEPAIIGIDVFIGKAGFEITARPQSELSISIPDVFDYDIKSLSIGKEDDKFYLETSGQIALTIATGGQPILPTPFDIKGLRIWQDGKVELKGGSIPLPKALTLKVGPAKLSVTAIHFGSHEQMHGGQMREYNYFGFDGGVSLDPGGVDARGDGIKFYYTTDTDPANNKPFHYFLGIEGIGIAIKIPGTASEKEAALILKGYLAIKNPDDAQGSDGGKEYIGAVTFAMPWQPAEWPLSHAYTTHTKKLHKLHTASECFSLGSSCSSGQVIEVINKVNYRP